MRLGCSGLKAHLHFNLHVEDNPTCRCGAEIENPEHYFLHCQQYVAPRIHLLNAISRLAAPSIYVILYGDPILSTNDNIKISLSVQKYIEITERFK